MTTPLRLVGPLADPQMLAALNLGAASPGQPLEGHLAGGARAGLEAGDWPGLRPGQGTTPTVTVMPGPDLWRYAAVMGLAARPVGPGPAVMGLGDRPAAGAAPWGGDWMPDLSASVATEILAAPATRDPAQIAARLPMIAVWAESRLRAAASPPSGGDLVACRGPDDLRLHDRREVFAGFFAVDIWTLSHRTHRGGLTPAVDREGFVMGDAVVVLPWDPVRDRVMLIEQFRFGPALRRDPQPWLLEPIAGRIDAGEGIEHAARREAQEEAGLSLGRLFPAVHHYPSPGAVTEFLYLYVGIADLPDGSAGIHGLDDETEDIRGHLIARDDLSRMVAAGQITNGPLAMLSLWLDRQHDDLAAELTRS